MASRIHADSFDISDNKCKAKAGHAHRRQNADQSLEAYALS